MLPSYKKAQEQDMGIRKRLLAVLLGDQDTGMRGWGVRDRSLARGCCG